MKGYYKLHTNNIANINYKILNLTIIVKIRPDNYGKGKRKINLEDIKENERNLKHF